MLKLFFRHYNISQSSSGSKHYPGSRSPWAFIGNVCKYYGWNEYTVKWKMSWRNLLMYNAVIPDMDSSEGGSAWGSNNSKSVSSSISLFDIGKRLSEGKGV